MQRLEEVRCSSGLLSGPDIPTCGVSFRAVTQTVDGQHAVSNIASNANLQVGWGRNSLDAETSANLPLLLDMIRNIHRYSRFLC